MLRIDAVRCWAIVLFCNSCLSSCLSVGDFGRVYQWLEIALSFVDEL